MLVDRFLENAIEIDVDALCDGEETYVAAVMQHVEEAGVHSGDSACVLPAPSLDARRAREVESVVRRLAPALGTIGLINVQLAVADGEVYVLEANPRASRTVPFASKATGLNLVEAACRLAAGAKLRDLGLPPSGRRSRSRVKAAVLPFARFPGSDPVLGPEMRSTGEVMASASDLPTAFAKAERAAGRPLPTAGHGVPLASATPTRRRCARSRRRWPGSDSSSSRPRGPPASCADAGLEVEQVAKVAEGGEATVVDLVRRGRCDLVVNTPFGGSLQRTDGYRIREAALVARCPASRRSPARAAAVHAIANARDGARLSLQERIEVETRSGQRFVARGGRPYRSSASSADALDPGVPGQFFMLEAPGRLLPRPMSLCLAPRGELAFLVDPVGPGTRALAALEPGDAIARLRAARQRLPARRRAAAARRRRHRDRAAAVPLRGGSARRPPCSASGREWHAQAAALVPNAEVAIDPVLVTDLLRDRLQLAPPFWPAAPSRCSRRCASSAPTPSSRGRRRWPAATAPATAAPSRSTASGSVCAWKGRCYAAA